MNLNPTYDIGQPALRDLWVDPVHGQDTNSGATRGEALRTLDAAWARIPELPTAADHGWQLLLCAGRFDIGERPHIDLTNRRADPEHPIIFRSADAGAPAELPAIRVNDCRAVYFIDLTIATPGRRGLPHGHNYVLWISDCEDMLVRRLRGVGLDHGQGWPRIVIKANQTRHLYIEDCDLSCAEENTIDYVAVQYGHIVRNRLHNTRCENLYVKGGSAYHLIAGNEVSGSANHGIMAGQCTGFQFMVNPWLHYEAYDIKVVNNLISDAGGGLAVTGGFNILMAYNTCVRVGSSRDTIVVGQGGRGWTPEALGSRGPLLAAHIRAGGWCNPAAGVQFNIPCRNVTIANNLIFNPDGYESRFAHCGISGPVATTPESHIPSPARCDDGLILRGNLIWNGGPDKPVLDDVEDMYHLAARPDFSVPTLLENNWINTCRPELIDPEHGDFRPRAGGSVYGCPAVALADFTWAGAPTTPPVPPGSLDNQVPVDRLGRPRTAGGAIGAFA
ncbi:MAG: hypothetical protein ACREJ2_02965 [Planctomycetota bacterium]